MDHVQAGTPIFFGSLFAGPGILKNINPLEVQGRDGCPTMLCGGEDKNWVSRWLCRVHELEVSHCVCVALCMFLLLSLLGFY